MLTGPSVERSFTVVRRGFDPDEVRRHLTELAREMSRLRSTEDELRARVAELEAKTTSTASFTAATEPPKIDDDTLLRHLGEETARVLTAAREAAAEIRTKAEEGMATLLRDAQADAARMKSDAEIESARIRQTAQTEVDAQIEAAKAEGRQMVSEAQAVRERMLGDLAKRRHAAREQLLLMKESRDRLLEAFDGVRTTLVDVNSLLRSAAPDPALDLGPTPSFDLSTPVTDTKHEFDSVVDAAAAARVAAQFEDTDDDDDDVDEPRGGVFEPTPARGLPVVVVTQQETVVAEVIVAEPAVELEPVVDTEPIDVEPAEAARLDDEIIDLSEERSPGASPEPGSAPGLENKATVDDLFARIRAANVETVAQHASAVVNLQEAPMVTSAPVAVMDTASTSASAVDELAESSESDADEAERPAELVARDKALDAITKQMARKLKRALADEQNEAFDRLRRAKVISVDAVLGAADEHAARYREAAGDALADAVNASGGRIAVLVPGLLDDVDREISVPLRERMAAAIAEAGTDPQDVSDVLRSAYREWKVQRIDEKAAELAFTAYERGSFDAIPAGASVCWMIDPRERPCADADDNVLAGAITKGEAFPTGQQCAPAHAGCRCHVTIASN
ncbi:MAG: hypothetical protein AB7L13_00025 [Acidimicrobiia bacterium]